MVSSLVKDFVQPYLLSSGSAKNDRFISLQAENYHLESKLSSPLMTPAIIAEIRKMKSFNDFYYTIILQSSI